MFGPAICRAATSSGSSATYRNRPVSTSPTATICDIPRLVYLVGQCDLGLHSPSVLEGDFRTYLLKQKKASGPVGRSWGPCRDERELIRARTGEGRAR